MTNAGGLRWRVRFDKPVLSPDPNGGQASAWSPQFTVSASIDPMRGTEAVIEQRLNSQQPYLIKVRYSSQSKDIDASWRAVEVIDGKPVRYFGIKTAEDMERKREFITLLAVAGAADGGEGDADGSSQT